MNTNTTATNRTAKIRTAALVLLLAVVVAPSLTACNAGRLKNYMPRTKAAAAAPAPAAPAVRLETLPAERD